MKNSAGIVSLGHIMVFHRGLKLNGKEDCR